MSGTLKIESKRLMCSERAAEERDEAELRRKKTGGME